jgi:hypothetical protein
VLINGELSIGAFPLTILLQFYPCYYLTLSFYSYTCGVPTISVLNLAIFPSNSNLLLRRRRWTGILRWGVLGYVLPRLPFLWSYGVFHCSVSLRVIIVFRDITYSWHLVICEHFWPYVWNNWSWSCIRWVLDFGIKSGYDKKSPGFLEDDQGVLWYKGRIFVPNDKELKDKILHEAHESTYSIHPGGNRMYHDLKANRHQGPARMLQPSQVPEWK